MRKFISRLILFAFCLAAPLLLFFLVIAQRFPFDMSTLVQQWESKMTRLSSRPEEKPLLVIVGGSNCYLGIEDELMYTSLSNRYYVVNIGLHAGLGLGRMLEEIVPHLRKGDVVCLAGEYSHYVDEKNYSGGMVSIAFTIDYKQKPLNLFFSRQYASYPHTGWCGYFRGKIENILGKKNSCGTGTPDLNTVLPVPHERYVNRGIPPQHPWQPNEESFKWLGRFAEDMKARGVRVIFTAPAFDARKFELHKDEIPAIKERLEGLGFECISDAADYAFPLDLMYDTEYHLNSRGRIIRTERLLRDIKRAGIAE